MPRNSKKSKEVDVSQFQELIDEAMVAFGSDVAYAVSISRTATAIERKRQVWQAKKLVREAEAKAQAKCSQTTFVCKVDHPCGTGDCKFATEPLSDIYVITKGTTQRPKNSKRGPYSIEDVVTEVRKKCLE